MKVAVISDIHSNIFALDAVLDDIARENVDIIVNLGDILYGPIAPRQTYERLMYLESECRVMTIAGNQDRQIFDATESDAKQNLTLRYILGDLCEEALSWMRNLPKCLSIADEIFLCHGTPDNDVIYLLEDVSTGEPIVRGMKEIENLLNGEQSSLILCGHTHIPRIVKVNNSLIVNPGSVGLPAYSDELPNTHVMETYSPHANYCVLEKTERDWLVAQKTIAYDFQASAALATERGRGDWAFSLTTGRAFRD